MKLLSLTLTKLTKPILRINMSQVILLHIVGDVLENWFSTWSSANTFNIFEIINLLSVAAENYGEFEIGC